MNKIYIKNIIIIGIFIILFGLCMFIIWGDFGTEANAENSKIKIPEIEASRADYNSKIDFIEEKVTTTKIKSEAVDLFNIKKETPVNKQNNTTTQKKYKTKKRVKKIQPQPYKIYNKQISADNSHKEPLPKKRKKRRFSNINNTRNLKKDYSQLQTSPVIKVKVHGNYNKITSKSKILVRTSSTYTIQGKTIPQNTLISGITSFTGNRIQIKFTAIYLQGAIIPVKFQAYSLDGMQGIFVEGAGLNDDKKDIGGAVIEEASNMANVPIIGGALNSILKRRNKKISVYIPSNYPLILKSVK